MYRRRKLLFFILVFLFALIFWEGFLHNKMLGVSYSCSFKESINYLNSLCFNYTNKRLTGTLCKPLCSLKISIKKCLGHGNKPHVLEVEWKGQKMILKAGQHNPYYRDHMPSKNMFNLTATSIIKSINRTIYTDHFLDKWSWIPKQAAAEIVKECDIDNDGVFHYEEASICWRLATTVEYLILLLLKENNAMMDLYGTCGTMYAVEYISAEPFYVSLSFIPDDKSWQLRSKVVLAVLEMVEALEYTPFGSLYLCDIDRGNIGVVKKKDGSLIAKPLDLDSAVFEKNLIVQLRSRAAQGQKCTRHSHCSRMFCASKCNIEKGICSGRPSSSNFLTVCRRFFRPTDVLHRNLLENPPIRFRDRINKVLEKCSKLGNPHIDRKLINEFKTILMDSIDSYQHS